MGVGVSGWPLARAVSLTGQLGVVSGTMLDVVMARQLQLGDEGGHLRRALAACSLPDAAGRFLDRYFIPGGKPAEAAFRGVPMVSVPPTTATLELSVLATFTAVWLAKEGHDGVVGLNLLEKSQVPTLPLLYGAMLAGVDVVLMGAGIPRQIPGVLDAFAAGEVARMRLDVTGAPEPIVLPFDPAVLGGSLPSRLKRPLFLAVVSSPVLAENLRRKANGHVDGFVVESPTAGGHNAPPRGALQLNERNEPVYGPRDAIDAAKFRALGLPFWLAGGFGRKSRLRDAQAEGAHGVQAGTPFALSDESGFDTALKKRIVDAIRHNDLEVLTDVSASPTGFPFKISQLPGSLSDPEIYEGRTRVCDIGVLREPYLKPDGGVGFRCSAEPVDQYVAKGGSAERAAGAMCLCNSLGASAGVAQLRAGGQVVEPSLVTLGDDLESIRELLPPVAGGYGARQVVEHLLARDGA